MNDRWEVGEYWLAKAFAWAWPSIWCAALMYGMRFIESLSAQGGWRAVLAVLLTIVGKSLYEYLKKYFTGSAAAILVALAATAAFSTAHAAPPAPPLAICVPCEVVTVHDGDTATEVILKIHVQVRYLNCWAPELKDPGGKDSRDSAKTAEGKTGRLFIPIGTANNIADLLTFGRVLGEIWLDGSNESESQRQVRLKMASTKKGGELGR